MGEDFETERNFSFAEVKTAGCRNEFLINGGGWVASFEMEKDVKGAVALEELKF